MRIVEILDSENINSFNIESWLDECARFRLWYCKLGTQNIDEVEMAKAYLKIEHKTLQNESRTRY